MYFYCDLFNVQSYNHLSSLQVVDLGVLLVFNDPSTSTA